MKREDVYWKGEGGWTLVKGQIMILDPAEFLEVVADLTDSEGLKELEAVPNWIPMEERIRRVFTDIMDADNAIHLGGMEFAFSHPGKGWDKEWDFDDLAGLFSGWLEYEKYCMRCREVYAGKDCENPVTVWPEFAWPEM